MHFRSRSARLRLAVRRGLVVSDQLSGIRIFQEANSSPTESAIWINEFHFFNAAWISTNYEIDWQMHSVPGKESCKTEKNGLHCTFLQDFLSCGQLNLLHEDISHLHVELLLGAALSQHPIPCMFLLVWSKLGLILFMILTSGASSSAQNPTRLLGREASFSMVAEMELWT